MRRPQKKDGGQATAWSVYQGHDRIGRVKLDKRAYAVFNLADQQIGTAGTLLEAARMLTSLEAQTTGPKIRSREAIHARASR